MSERSNPNDETSMKVRQNARFKCKACNSFGLKQRAHIIPHKYGGTVDVNNLVWMCEGCQRMYEPAGLSGFMFDAAVRNMIELRDTESVDSLVSGIFNDLLAHPDKPIVIETGNVRLIAETIFSEPDHCWNPSYLRFYKHDQQIRIEGRLKNENGFVIIEFKNENLTFHTADAWDIVRKPRMLRFESKNRNTFLQIKQTNDGIVRISAKVYVGGGILELSSKGIHLPNNSKISNLTIESQHVLAINSCSPMPRPYGHIHPNVI